MREIIFLALMDTQKSHWNRSRKGFHRKHTSTIDDMTMSHDHHLIFVALIISVIGTPIKATTTGLMPLNIRMTYSLSLNEVKNMATRRMIRNGGRQLAIVATTLPLMPRSLCPVRMEMFTAKRPGAVWARVIMSIKSSSFSHFLSTSSLLMAAIIGMPPPIVNAPIFPKTRNICHKLIIFMCVSMVSKGKSRKIFQKNLKKFAG